MGKGMIIVMAGSGAILVLFCVFSFLMSTVNPNPLVFDVAKPKPEPNKVEDPTMQLKFRASTEDNKPTTQPGEVLFLKDFLSKQIGALRYGIEKADTSKSNEKSVNTTKSGFLYFVPDKRRHDDTKTAPIKTNTTNSKNIAARLFKKVLEREERERRSISKTKLNTRAIILKIKDDTGRTRLTMNIEPNAFEHTYVLNENYDIPDGKSRQKYLNTDTVINILPNNSLTMDKYDQSQFYVDFASKNEVIVKINKKTMDIMKNVSSTSNEILQTLKNDNLVVYNADNSTVA